MNRRTRSYLSCALLAGLASATELLDERTKRYMNKCPQCGLKFSRSKRWCSPECAKAAKEGLK